jgi:hypothetical protein
MNPKRDLWICVVITLLLLAAGAAFLGSDDGFLAAGPFWFWALVSIFFVIRNWRRWHRQRPIADV